MSLDSGMIERAGLVAAVEQAADGIVITDTGGQIRYVNPAFTAMTGYTSEEAVGQHTRILRSDANPRRFTKNSGPPFDPAVSGMARSSTGARMEPSTWRRCGSRL